MEVDIGFGADKGAGGCKRARVPGAVAEPGVCAAVGPAERSPAAKVARSHVGVDQQLQRRIVHKGPGRCWLPALRVGFVY